MPEEKPIKILINPCRHCHEKEQFKNKLCSSCACPHCHKRIPPEKSNLCLKCFELPIEKHLECETCLCAHCANKAKHQSNLCTNCILIPKCKDCTIIMGYYNEPLQEIEYNTFNQITNPSTGRCVGCESYINH